MEHTLAGHFRTTALLKAGRGVDTYLGVDLDHDEKNVVIKKTRSSAVSAAAQLRLEHEAEVLSQLSDECHCLAPPIGVGREAGEFFLVAPYVPGPTLAERLERGALDVAGALAVARGLMRALAEAHEHTIIHRDVKPANIVLSDSADGRPTNVTLIDFGLARTARVEPWTQDEAEGTITYVSPEQAGLIDFDVGERADLYSAGIVLFECLAGGPPFVGDTVADVLRQHLTTPAPSLRSLGLAVPRALDAIVAHLLHKDPRDRYQSARAALADLDALSRALAAGQREPALVVGLRDRRQSLTEPAFVGRERELSALDDELHRARAGEPRLVFVEAESGAGKSRLLEEVAVRGAQMGAWVLRARATSSGAGRPLEILQGVARAIVARAREDSGLAERLRERLGEHRQAVCAALPVLCAIVAPDEPSELGAEAHGEARTLPALTALLDALGTLAELAVVFLDDTQAADELSLKVLAAWQRAHATAESATNVLLVVAYRSDEVAVGHSLRRLTPHLRLALAPLTGDEIRRLAESMAGTLPTEATTLVERLAQGSPFFAAAALEGLVEGGALVPTADGWSITPRALELAQSSSRGASFLAHRVERLPESVLELLSACAILGKTFDLLLAAELAGRPLADAIDDLAEARRRHLVWAESHGERYRFAHDRVRERMLERLPGKARRTLHRLAAQRLEAVCSVRDEAAARSSGCTDLAFDLAYHYDEAGDAASALPYALEAASRARAQYAFEIAERQYRIAERGVGEEDRERRGEIAEALGDVLMLRGKYEEAAIQLGRACALATSPVAAAGIEGKLGELSFKRGRVEDAGAALERALSTLGWKVPSSSLAIFLAMLARTAVQVLHTLFPSWLRRGDPERREAELLAARLFSRLAYAYWFYRGQVATFWAHLSELNLAERYPRTRELAQAYSEHALGMTGLPRLFYRRGHVYAERSLSIRRELGDVPGEAQSLSFYGMLLHAEGRYEDALQRFRESERVLGHMGDLWEANIAGFQAASCLYRTGALREAVEECRRVFKQGSEIGDVHGSYALLEIWAKASGGAVPPELIAAALASSRSDPQIHETALQAEAVRLLREGEPLSAVAALAEAEEVVRRAKLESEYVSYLGLWRGHALRVAAEQAEGGILATRRRPLPDAERAIRRAVRVARRYRGNLPMALRERALLLARRGAFRRAQRFAERSVVLAESLGMRFEHAQSLLVRGELRRVRQRAGGEGDVARARELLRSLGGEFVLSRATATQEPATITLSLADRFEAVVDAGRRIAAAPNKDEIYQAACAAASALLRGQSSSVLVAAGDDLRTVASAGRTEITISPTLVRRALAQGTTVVWTDGTRRATSESITLTGVRSALCAPIFVGGRACASLYVTHDLVGSLFGDDERRLAEYIVALTGASLEKADAFAQLHALSLDLEQRVRDRTAELRTANAELDANLRRLRETQEQLLQSGKMAAVGTLVAGLSHEINNPIAVIVAQTQNLLRKLDERDPMRAAIEAIGRQSTRCAGLVRTMLDFTRKSSGAKEPTCVSELLHEVIELARTRARGVDVRLQLEGVSTTVPRVDVSRTEIESALLNLVNNAIDASGRGSVVRVGAESRVREGRPGVELYVEDHGPGIPPEVASRIFDPFFTTKPVGQGTGLGLSLALQIVEAHGGKLWVGTPRGSGTTMCIWLPEGATP